MTSTSTSKKDIVLEIQNFRIDYKIPFYRSHGFRDSFIGAISSPIDFFFKPNENILILDNINLTLRKGDRLGILGNNGTGKTSLCRYICGIYGNAPAIKSYGEIKGIFDTSVSVLPELSGRENLEILTHLFYPELSAEERNEINKEAEIFCNIGKYLDAPLKTYSKGMLTRLFLSVVTNKPTDLLVLDEVFNGADYFFSEKVSARIRSLIESSGAVIFVSHSQEIIREVCNRVIVFHDKSIAFDGPPNEAIEFYLKNCQSTLIQNGQTN